MNSIKKLVLNNTTEVLFIAYTIITLFLYKNTYNAGMVFDFNGWAEKYEHGTFVDALNCFGYPGLHQVEQITFFTLYKLFGFNGKLWYILFAILHTLAAVQGFLLLNILLNETNNKKEISFYASLLFLISPLASDVIVSKVTIHYLLSAVFIFSCLRFYLEYEEKKFKKYLVFSVIYFILALFSLEIAYAVPIAITFIYFIQNKFKLEFNSFKIPLTYVIVLILFLLLHKIKIGSFIGHYGAETHTKFILAQIIANLLGYISGYITFFDFYPHHIKIDILSSVNKYFWVFLLLCLVAIIIIIYKKLLWNKKILVLILLCGLSIIFLLPIINLFLTIVQNENDRYGYLASIFIYATFAFVIYKLFSKRIAATLLIFYSIISLFMSVSNIKNYEIAGDITSNVINDFKWYNKSKIYILVQPENVNGVRMFTSLSENNSEFASSLLLEKGIDIKDKTELIYEMNVNNIEDSIKIKVINPSHLHVEIGNWGTWFWKHHNGATSYNSQNYYTEVSNNGLAFDIHFKNPIKNDEALIYYNKGKWHEVKF